MVAGGVSAQSEWQEYSYPDQQFAVSFPGDPSIQVFAVQQANGRPATETLYTARYDKGLFQVEVVDFGAGRADGAAVIDGVLRDLRARAQVTLDLPARVQGAFGRYLDMAGKDGTHSIGAVFFTDRRLYEIEATEPPWKLDPLSGDMIRFQQSLRFMGRAAGQPVRRQGPGEIFLLGDRLFAAPGFGH